MKVVAKLIKLLEAISFGKEKQKTDIASRAPRFNPKWTIGVIRYDRKLEMPWLK